MITADDVDTARRLAREKPSASYLQRKMLISYTDALILMDILKEEERAAKLRYRLDGTQRWQG